MKANLLENGMMDIESSNNDKMTTSTDLKERKEKNEDKEINDEASTGGSSLSDSGGIGNFSSGSNGKNSHGKPEKEKEETVKKLHGKPEVSEYTTLKYRQIRNPNYKKISSTETTPCLGKDSGIVLLSEGDTINEETGEIEKSANRKLVENILLDASINR